MMDAKRLEEIEKNARESMATADPWADFGPKDILELVAEVKRLRALIPKAEFAGEEACCPFCECPNPIQHFADCPAFSARGVVR